MTEDICTLSRISATPEARATLRRVRETHKEIMFHVTRGCCDARSPVCLPRGELRLGSLDALIGYVEGVPVYEMRQTIERRGYPDYVLDVMPGTSVGFSLEAGTGVRFTLREILPERRDSADILTVIGIGGRR